MEQQASQDAEYLKLLSIFHYVVAGFAGLFACFPIFHLAIGLGMLTGGFGGFPSNEAFPFQLFGLMFTVIPAAIILGGWTFAICVAISGYFLSRRKKYMFCFVMAAISTVFMPFGTVLGVFTILVLLRSPVKEMFEKAQA